MQEPRLTGGRCEIYCALGFKCKHYLALLARRPFMDSTGPAFRGVGYGVFAKDWKRELCRSGRLTASLVAFRFTVARENVRTHEWASPSRPTAGGIRPPPAAPAN